MYNKIPKEMLLSFVRWLDMINSHSFYAGNNVKVVKDDKIRNLFLDTYTI